MTTLGFDLFDVSLRGADATLSFVELFASSMQFYHENFYSLAERAQEAARQFRVGLQDIGLQAVPRTAEAFRALVDRLMDNGRTRAAAELIQLAPLLQQMLSLRDQANPVTTSTGNVVSFSDRLEVARRAAQSVGTERFSTSFQHERAQANAAQAVLRSNANQTQQEMLTEMRAAAQSGADAGGAAPARAADRDQHAQDRPHRRRAKRRRPAPGALMTGSWRTDKRKTAERGYGGKWQRLSKQFLRQAENALCVMCEAEGQTKQAEVVDHITPHKGDQTLFWDPTNWQGLCKSHHSRDKQAEERGFKKCRRIGVDGYPI